MPILLFNCGLWTLFKLLNDKLDEWGNPRVLMQIVYPQRITNKNLHAETKSPASATCRLLWFGHWCNVNLNFNFNRSEETVFGLEKRSFLGIVDLITLHNVDIVFLAETFLTPLYQTQSLAYLTSRCTGRTDLVMAEALLRRCEVLYAQTEQRPPPTIPLSTCLSK